MAGNRIGASQGASSALEKGEHPRAASRGSRIAPPFAGSALRPLLAHDHSTRTATRRFDYAVQILNGALTAEALLRRFCGILDTVGSETRELSRTPRFRRPQANKSRRSP